MHLVELKPSSYNKPYTNLIMFAVINYTLVKYVFYIYKKNNLYMQVECAAVHPLIMINKIRQLQNLRYLHAA